MTPDTTGTSWKRGTRTVWVEGVTDSLVYVLKDGVRHFVQRGPKTGGPRGYVRVEGKP